MTGRMLSRDVSDRMGPWQAAWGQGACTVAIWLCLAAVLVVGCKKREALPSNPPKSAEASMPPAHGSGVAQAPAAPVIVADQGDVNANLQQMTLELRRFVVSTRSVPKDFDDFVARSHAQFPPAPAGKKYRIQDQAIVLVNR